MKERKLWQIKKVEEYTGIKLPKPSYAKKKKKKKVQMPDRNKAVISALDKVIKSAGQSPKSFAKGGQFVTSGPEAIVVGDNPSGKELVTVKPIPKSKGPAKYNKFDMNNLNMALSELDETKKREDKEFVPGRTMTLSEEQY